MAAPAQGFSVAVFLGFQAFCVQIPVVCANPRGSSKPRSKAGGNPQHLASSVRISFLGKPIERSQVKPHQGQQSKALNPSKVMPLDSRLTSFIDLSTTHGSESKRLAIEMIKLCSQCSWKGRALTLEGLQDQNSHVPNGTLLKCQGGDF